MADKRREERMRVLEEQLATYVELLDNTSSTTASETAVRLASKARPWRLLARRPPNGERRGVGGPGGAVAGGGGSGS